MSLQSQSWDRVWLAYERYADDVRRIAQAIAPDGESDEDLVHTFVLDRLPDIVERIEALPEPERRSYVRASFRNFVRSARRTATRSRRALETLGRELDVHTEAPGHDVLPVDHALRQVPERLAAPLRRFLGVGCPSQSVRQLAEELAMTRHSARLAVLDGFLALAARLGERGALTSRELAVCELLLLQGVDAEHAASELGITRQQVKQALSRARSLVSASLK